MGRTKGSQNLMTRQIKEAVEHAFRSVNGKRNAGLIALAKNEPKVFYSLVARCIPATVAVDVQHHVVDLGKAMIVASETLAAINQQIQDKVQLIDITPVKVTVNTSEPETPISKPLELNDK